MLHPHVPVRTRIYKAVNCMWLIKARFENIIYLLYNTSFIIISNLHLNCPYMLHIQRFIVVVFLFFSMTFNKGSLIDIVGVETWGNTELNYTPMFGDPFLEE